MNFTAEQMKPLRNLGLLHLKSRLNEPECLEAKPAKIAKLEEEPKDEPDVGFDSLNSVIIACRTPHTIAKELLRLLIPSGNFVIFCPYIEVSAYYQMESLERLV